MARKRGLRVVAPERLRPHPLAIEFAGGAIAMGELILFSERDATHPEVRPPGDELTVVPGVGYLLLRLWPRGVNGSPEARAEYDAIVDAQEAAKGRDE